MKSQTRATSFKAAFNGLIKAFQYECNFRIHCVMTLLVICLARFFKVTTLEWLFLLVAIGAVLVTELLNSAIEYTVDFITEDYHEKAKLIKDLAAAAVLVSAIGASLTGLIIFYPRVIDILGV